MTYTERYRLFTSKQSKTINREVFELSEAPNINKLIKLVFSLENQRGKDNNFIKKF